jgi:hypothetical protein
LFFFVSNYLFITNNSSCSSSSRNQTITRFST